MKKMLFFGSLVCSFINMNSVLENKERNDLILQLMQLQQQEFQQIITHYRYVNFGLFVFNDQATTPIPIKVFQKANITLNSLEVLFFLRFKTASY